MREDVSYKSLLGIVEDNTTLAARAELHPHGKTIIVLNGMPGFEDPSSGHSAGGKAGGRSHHQKSIRRV